MTCAAREPIFGLGMVEELARLGIWRGLLGVAAAAGDPAIYVAQPYGGMDPAQMEGYLTYYYEYHFLYITGLDHVESKSIQGAALMKLVFHEGTNMSQAMSETVGCVNRARVFMPLGTVRPFGGNQRTIVVMLDPDKLRQYQISPEEAIAAVGKATLVMPSGKMWTGNVERIARTNAALGGDLSELLATPIRPVSGAGNVEITSDFVGVVPSSYPVDLIHLFTSGPQEAVIQVALKPDAARGEPLRERLREALRRELPGTQISFEAADIVSQVMSFGSPTPIEVAVQGISLQDDYAYAQKVQGQMAKLSFLEC